MTPPDIGIQRPHTNFGGNQTWFARSYRPRSEAEVLEILARHRHGHIRVAGARHSWSDAATCDDVCLDLGLLDDVQAPEGDGLVRVGGGCTIQRLLEQLHTRSGRTLPTMGVIKRQTIAGAISTGTHGSGSQGLSHFVQRVRVAGYDADGQPRIFEHSEGDALRASRCAIGCTGVILSVDLQTVPQHCVEETVRYYDTLDEVLERLNEFPLTQFAYVPFQEYFVSFERERVPPPVVSTWRAQLFRLYYLFIVDVGSHLFVKLAAWLGGASGRVIFKTMGSLYLAVRNRRRVDLAERVLTMEHDLFRHEEMEIFVAASKLPRAIALLRGATRAFAGDPVTPEEEAILDTLGFVPGLRGSFTPHYPPFIRRVLPEDTLMSMAGGAREPVFSISIFSYAAPSRRGPYYAYCEWLCAAMTRLFDARLHWGKQFPQSARDVKRLCPRLDDFERVCAQVDPHGVFRNQYTRRVLGMPPGRPARVPGCSEEAA